jgi:hypothetical protein
MAAIRLSSVQIKQTYELISKFHTKFLKKAGVHLPKFGTLDALALIYLVFGYPKTRIISKGELTEFLRKYNKDIIDTQQGRHLSAQQGWNIVAGSRGAVGLRSGEYKLVSLETPYPQHHGHRVTDNSSWDAIKQSYNMRCATCGSLEDEPVYHWPGTITKLQAGHMDPSKALIKGNIIPQCQICNRPDRNRWVYDERGRVVALADPRFILKSNEEVQREVLKILKSKYGG